jgi:serine/threonine protein phosphatase 1
MADLPLTHEDDHRLFVHAGVRPGVPLNAQSAEDFLWIRRPFLDYPGPFPKYIVHGHSPTLSLSGASRRPHVLTNRCNVDTGAVYGGPLSAAIFLAEKAMPIAVLTTDDL